MTCWRVMAVGHLCPRPVPCRHGSGLNTALVPFSGALRAKGVRCAGHFLGHGVASNGLRRSFRSGERSLLRSPWMSHRGPENGATYDPEVTLDLAIAVETTEKLLAALRGAQDATG